jgi:hypothetical protein
MGVEWCGLRDEASHPRTSPSTRYAASSVGAPSLRAFSAPRARIASSAAASSLSAVKRAMIVRLDYGVDRGRDRIRTTGVRDPFWDPWYGSGFGYGRGFGYGYRPYYRRSFYSPFYSRGVWGYGWQDPFFFGSGYDDIDVVTVYTSELDLKIDSRADGRRLFEGKAQAASRSNRLGYLVPNLDEAMFTDFHGHNGETVRITIAPEDGKRTIRPVRDREYDRDRY